MLNKDKYKTEEEAINAFLDFCTDHDCCLNDDCPLCKKDECSISWMFLESEVK